MAPENEALDRLGCLRKNLHVAALVLGVIALVIAQFAETSRATGLYSLVAAGPVLIGLITFWRYAASEGSARSIAKIIAECGWVCLSFGLGYYVMLPSSYYAVRAAVSAPLLIDGGVLILLGAYALYTVGKLGYSLTP